jgi:hypothetical protein
MRREWYKKKVPIYILALRPGILRAIAADDLELIGQDATDDRLWVMTSTEYRRLYFSLFFLGWSSALT